MAGPEAGHGERMDPVQFRTALIYPPDAVETLLEILHEASSGAHQNVVDSVTNTLRPGWVQ